MRIICFVTMALVVMFFASCSNNSKSPGAENTTDSSSIASEETIPSLDETFPGLYNYLHSQDSSFSIQGFGGGVVEQKPDSLDRNQDTSQLRLFYPYLLFNADSTMALDLVSYNYVALAKDDKIYFGEAGPDYEVALIDFTSGKRKRLLFFGTIGTVLDAKWQDPYTILIAGTTEWKGEDSMLPVIWKYELPTKSWSVFQYEKMIKADWREYKTSLIWP